MRRSRRLGAIFALDPDQATYFLIPSLSARVARKGEINAWDSPDFVAAVKATGRKTLIIAGTITGTYSKMAQEITLARMVQAGVIPMDTAAVASELQKYLVSRARDGMGRDLYETLSALCPSHRELPEGAGSRDEARADRLSKRLVTEAGSRQMTGLL